MVKTKTRTRQSMSDRVFGGAVWLILIFFTVIVAIPMIHVVSASFSSASAVIQGVYLWPEDLSLRGYQAVFKNSMVVTGFLNSILYCVSGTFINVAVTICAAYPVARRKLPGRKLIMMLFIFTMLFSGGMIPTYLVVSNLNMVNTIWSQIIPGAMSVYLMIVARTFFENTIPEEMYEAAAIDGCNDIQTMLRIVLPLSKAIIAVLVLRYAVSHWNSYYTAMIYLRDDTKMPLQNVLRSILLATSNSAESTEMATSNAEEYGEMMQLTYLLKYSLIVISTVPMMCLYPFIQKHFVKGVMIGAVKG